ncbi:tRNA (N6-threonylcarbamoyladenosine(37)-N6)-methyltransferase TrmO [Clostridiaceae bacterium M8S5]|nr:tRNA (N6-threonylcarbamoyladenosine(37)-N6)-methyltransferase TrmO [Clostridiaceae bacterium M8S5]
MNEFIIKSIGYIDSPYRRLKDIPSQSIYSKEKRAIINIKDEYKEGLKDLDKFTYIVIQFYFHESTDYDLLTPTPWSEELKGVFSTRSPRRPNPIGITIAKLIEIKGSKLIIEGVDMLDKTPIIDIKPYLENLNPKID